MDIYILLTILAAATVSVSGQMCTDEACPGTHDCTDYDSFFTCMCKNGKTGPDCDKDDPCLPKTTDCPMGTKCFGPCSPNVQCLNANGLPQCSSCVLGMTGENCTEDEDECTTGYHTCADGSTCLNTVGSFKCVCPEGFVGSDCDCAKGSACDKEELVENTTRDQNEAGSGDPRDGAAVPSGTCFMMVTIAAVCHRIARAL